MVLVFWTGKKNSCRKHQRCLNNWRSTIFIYLLESLLINLDYSKNWMIQEQLSEKVTVGQMLLGKVPWNSLGIKKNFEEMKANQLYIQDSANECKLYTNPMFRGKHTFQNNMLVFRCTQSPIVAQLLHPRLLKITPGLLINTDHHFHGKE